ncbi:MAG: hypothetical protein ACAH80_01850 [Alphaproteobacteria bacterium]
MKNTNTGTKGSALVLTAIVILVAGLAGVGFLYSMRSTTRETQEEETIVKMNKVIHALSVYYQRYGRVPCPADPDTTPVAGVDPPYGAERGSGTSGTASGSCSTTTSLQDGIVPFKTIGLMEEDIKDAWGRYLTYHMNTLVSLSAADAASYLAANPNFKVHDLCRVKDVWVDRGCGTNCNWYPQQTMACCQKASNGLTITNSAGSDVTGNTTSPGNSEYGNHHAPAPIPSINTYSIPIQPAMILISHGANGVGAYVGTGTTVRSSTTGASAGEIANATGSSGNTAFVQMPRMESSSYYFDDIVIFETMSTLYGDVGNNSTDGCNFQPGCPPVPVASAFTNAWSPSPMVNIQTGAACP